MATDRTHFPALLARRIVEADITQAALASRLGVSEAAVNSWANGAYRPDMARIPALARAIGCSIEELVLAAAEPATDVTPAA